MRVIAQAFSWDLDKNVAVIRGVTLLACMGLITQMYAGVFIYKEGSWPNGQEHRICTSRRIWRIFSSNATVIAAEGERNHSAASIVSFLYIYEMPRDKHLPWAFSSFWAVLIIVTRVCQFPAAGLCLSTNLEAANPGLEYSAFALKQQWGGLNKSSWQKIANQVHVKTYED